MRILALDTSSAAGSAAVARDGALLVERAGDGSRHHAERLPRELMDVLAESGLTIGEIDVLAVCTGPGSFTGLRVGIATMQGLALAQRKRLVPVPAFEALAKAGASGAALVAAWIDARRGEVFASLYGGDGGIIAPPTSLAPEATLHAWSGALEEDGPVRFIGDGAIVYGNVIRAALGTRAVVPDTVPLLAGTIALLAAEQPERAVAPHAVGPLYVRRTDVELARERQSGRG